jgi:DNA-binding response OmpR family regulator
VVRAFRADASTAAVPMIALSTVLGESDRTLLLAEGVAAYIVKPCPPLTLLAEARRLLGA